MNAYGGPSEMICSSMCHHWPPNNPLSMNELARDADSLETLAGGIERTTPVTMTNFKINTTPCQRKNETNVLR